MLRRVIGDDVRLVCVLDSGAGTVRVDPVQMEQVLLNLGANARDAMPRGGTLTIETKDVELDGAYAHANAGVSPGPYVMLAMADSEAGISEEIQRHLFEPFFTTKGPGRAAGWGWPWSTGSSSRATATSRSRARRASARRSGSFCRV
jgi:two-component system cell cycle sensor histidine kinase/response regulator CckA